MVRLYQMLSVAGWVWLAILLGYVAVAGRRRGPRGGEVATDRDAHRKEP